MPCAGSSPPGASTTSRAATRTGRNTGLPRNHETLATPLTTRSQRLATRHSQHSQHPIYRRVLLVVCCEGLVASGVANFGLVAMSPDKPARAVFELRLVGKRNSRPARSIFLWRSRRSPGGDGKFIIDFSEQCEWNYSLG